jgi:predicted glycosyltransferase
MAGYNTTVEILQSAKRAILIPRRGPSAEQRTRAQLFAARGWIDMIDPDDLDADAVASLVIKSLGLPPYISAENRPDLHGVHVAAQTLLDFSPASSGPLSLVKTMRSSSYELADYRQ